MQLRLMINEYLFDCEYRKLSNKTRRNYSNLLSYLAKYLEEKADKK